MSLNKLDELRNDIPKVDDNLANIIYAKYNNKYNNKRISFFNIHKRLIFSISSLLIIIVVSIVALLVNGIDAKPEYEKVNLLYAAKDLEDASFASEGYNEFMNKTQEFEYSITESYCDNYNDSLSNIAISPISIYMALAMLAECSNEAARDEILTALGITYEDMLTHTEELYENLNKIVKDRYDKVILNNSIWFNHNLNLNNDILKSLSNYYYCTSYNVDWYNNNRGANNAIRKYIKKQTNGLIDQDFNIARETIFTVLNTLYLKTIWDSKELDLTNEEYMFYNADGTISSKRFVKGQYVEGRIFEEEAYRHFFIKSNGKYCMKIIIPNDGYTLKQVFTSDNLNTINNISNYYGLDIENNTRYITRMIFPEFSANSNESLNEILENDFNIKEVFNAEKRPLNITDDYAACSDIKHVTNLNVDRMGIEGAAATIFNAATSGPPMTTVTNDFVVDRAFGYMITDNEGNLLFSGVVNKI